MTLATRVSRASTLVELHFEGAKIDSVEEEEEKKKKKVQIVAFTSTM